MISLNDLSRLLNPVKRKLFLLVGKALFTAVNSTGAVGFYPAGSRKNPQRVSTEWFGKLTDIEHSQPYGFESYPIVGTAKVVLLSPDGSRGNTFAILVQDDTYRPDDLASGASCQYDNLGGRHVVASGKHAIGNKLTGNELLQLFDDLLTELQKTVDLGGTSSTGKLFKINPALLIIQNKLLTIKGSL